MRVLLDGQIAVVQRRGGISRYFTQLQLELGRSTRADVQVQPRHLWSANQHLLDAGLAWTPPAFLQRRKSLNAAVNLATTAPFVLAADVVHHTYYDPRYLHLSRGRQLRVMTIHDMIPELFPDLFPLGNPHGQKETYFRSADLVLAVSEATRRDITAVYGPSSVPIAVTPLGVAPEFFDPLPRPDLPERYVLFVGERAGYKDFLVAVEAYAAARLAPHVHLLAVGGGSFSPAEQDRLAQLGVVAHVHQRALTDRELIAAYQHADAFVFPSRYEGFGLPTLESMAAGCTTLLAESSSHPEVGGDAALYFPPGDTEHLAALLQRVAEDPDLREARRLAGRERARRFTWARTAATTIDAYAEGLAAAR